jgi:hypothetical protein
MSHFPPPPGQQCRQRARRHRTEALRSWGAAVTLGAYLVIITVYFVAPPIYVYALGVAAIATFLVVGCHAWQRANRADQCAKAEED